MLSSALRLLARQCAQAQHHCNEVLALVNSGRPETTGDPLVSSLLEPVVLRAGPTSIDVRFVVASSFNAGIALRVAPLNLGFAVLHGIRREQASGVYFEVESVPMAVSEFRDEKMPVPSREE